MKKFVLIAAGALSLVTLAWVQVPGPASPPLAGLMPAGPMIYLEAKDFHSLLNKWNQSGVKRSWLADANYRVFSNSNLLQKLNGLYREYGSVAGFLPGIAQTLEIAGTESALGLYDLREQHFVYITRVDESQLTKSQLWRLRDKFTTRQASGISFYERRDDATNRTVAFAFTTGWLVLATRDDLMAGTLGLIAAHSGYALSGELWYQTAAAQAGSPGELRMALNISSLVSDDRFRSYWIQRNIPELRAFNGSIADLLRIPDEITENRVFTRPAEQAITPPAGVALESLAQLRALEPDTAAFVRAWAAPSQPLVRSLIETKLLQPVPTGTTQSDYAPAAASTDEAAGSAQDLETRIDEPALPDHIAGALNSGLLRDMIAQAAPDALLQIQSSTGTGRFIRTPSVLVLSAGVEWDAVRVREAIATAVESLWSTARLGVAWQRSTLGAHSVEQLNGLATLLFAIDGKLLFLANDPALLASTLSKIGSAPLPAGPVYTAGFRHVRERPDYLSIMQALEFGPQQQSFLNNPQGDRTPPFFSENLASLSAAFSFVRTMSISTTDSPAVQKQTVIYR